MFRWENREYERLIIKGELGRKSRVRIQSVCPKAYIQTTYSYMTRKGIPWDEKYNEDTGIERKTKRLILNVLSVWSMENIWLRVLNRQVHQGVCKSSSGHQYLKDNRGLPCCQSENNSQLWMWLVMKVKSDAIKNNTAFSRTWNLEC